MHNDNDILDKVNTDVLPKNIKSKLNILGPINKKIVGEYLVLALESFESNEIKIAIKWIEKAVKRAGRISYIRKIAGILYYNNEQYKEAIKELNTANRLNNKNDLEYMIADSYRAIGDVNKANIILKNIINNNFSELSIEEKIETLIIYASIKREFGENNMSNLIIKDALKIAKNNLKLVDRINKSL